MQIKAIKTRKMIAPQEDLFELLEESLPKLKEKTIVAISSKIVSIGQGRAVSVHKVPDKDQLIIDQAEYYIPRELVPGHWVIHTLKNNLFIPTSGIDESNGAGHFILWPENPQGMAKKIWQFLRRKYKVKLLGVILTDSHSVPLRRGLVGLCLGFWGFKPLRDYRGLKDLFGHTLEISQTNIPDSLASSAVFVMGEGSEQTPIAILEDAPAIEFVQQVSAKILKSYSDFSVGMDEDLYAPFIKSMPWKKGGAKSKLLFKPKEKQ